MRRLRILLAYLFLFCLCLVELAGPVAAENWPGWRGPRGDGTSLESGIPIQWNGLKQENVAWKVPLPGLGHASPIVWEDRVFTISCPEETDDRVLLCFDRKTGRLLWQRVVVHSPLEGKHKLNSHASSTPATDGRSVFVTFLDRTEMLVAAYDFAGNQRWLVRPGEFYSKHGYCSSVVLFENLVILNGDHDGDAYLLGLDRDTGKTVWKTLRENKTRSYSTPIIRRIDGRTQMILSGSLSVASYDPRDGSRHWIIDGPTEQFVASLVYNGELLFLTAGFPELHIMAIRPDGHGNVTDTHVVWHTRKGCSYVPSPIASADGKYFLVVSDDGIASLFEAATGHRHWMERIGPHYSASLVSADGLVHFLSDEGVTTIVRPGEELDVVATSELGEPCYASPAISQGQIFLRAEKHLYCIGAGGDQERMKDEG
ncbi:MAG: serine/threonine protein kinase [Planctomycetes bacterium RBG_16_64_12]|nr:MAG: serine/threonine protein kinase [Planctomycetes bacterium RBG_16_64_12]